MKALMFLFAALTLSTACAKEAANEPGVKVFKARGTVQCDTKPGIAPEAMRAELEKAGIKVKKAVCGTDGQMHADVCGGADGAINIFEIPQSKAAKAAELGFANLATLPDAAETPCP